MQVCQLSKGYHGIHAHFHSLTGKGSLIRESKGKGFKVMYGIIANLGALVGYLRIIETTIRSR